jgi:hypothetical protein
MKGTDFPEATLKLLPPEGHEEEVYPLHVWRHPEGGMVISKWKMTWRERLSCLWNGYVWFHCWGNTHPPMSIETSYPFERDSVLGIRRSIIFVAILTALVLAGTVFLYFSETY